MSLENKKVQRKSDVGKLTTFLALVLKKAQFPPYALQNKPGFFKITHKYFEKKKLSWVQSVGWRLKWEEKDGFYFGVDMVFDCGRTLFYIQ